MSFFLVKYVFYKYDENIKFFMNMNLHGYPQHFYFLSTIYPHFVENYVYL